MKGRIILLPAMFLLAVCSLQGMSLVPESSEKPIKAVLEFYPNYAGHLLGVAQIGYDSDYADRYQSTIQADDLKYLKDHADLLAWSDDDEGILSYFFLTFPGFINPETKDELAVYLTDLNSAIAAKSFDNFAEKYAEPISKLDRWTGFNSSGTLYTYGEEIQMLSRILMNNYDRFKEKVWPIEKKKVAHCARLLNSTFADMDLIHLWESITGIAYDAPDYQVSLSMGMENGPTAKSMGYQKDWYYFDENPDRMIQKVCQEAGARILSSLCKGHYDLYDPRLCFQVYQAMSLYCTQRILDAVGIAIQTPEMDHIQQDLYGIIQALTAFSPNISVDQLYEATLDTYSQTFFAMNTD